MKLPRLSLALLLIATAVAGADFSWARWFIRHKRSMFFGSSPMGLDFGIVPMGSILVLCGVHIACRRGKVASHTWGFFLSGSAVLVGYGTVAACAPNLIIPGLRRIYARTTQLTGVEELEPLLRPFLPDIGMMYTHVTWVMILLTIPQILIALAGGALFTYLSRRRESGSIVSRA